jgi:hypothetical protein
MEADASGSPYLQRSRYRARVGERLNLYEGNRDSGSIATAIPVVVFARRVLRLVLTPFVRRRRITGLIAPIIVSVIVGWRRRFGF